MIGRTLLRLDRHRRVDRGEEAFAVQAGGDDRQRADAVLRQPVCGRGRRAAGDGRVDGRRERVEIRVGAARRAGVAAVLLDRCEAGLERRRRRVPDRLDRMRRGSEPEQHRSDRRQQDGVGADVLVPGAGAVQHGQRIEHGLEPDAQLGLARHVVELAERGPERRPFEIRHRHVGGAVLFPEAVDLDERGMVEAGEQTCLVDEAGQARLEGVEMPVGRGNSRRVVGAHGDRRREVLLDRDLALQRRVPAQVDDAERTLADQPIDLVVAQARAERQRVPGVRLRRRARLLEIGGRGHLVKVLLSRRRVGRGSRRCRCRAGLSRGGPGIVAPARWTPRRIGAASGPTKSRRHRAHRATIARSLRRCDGRRIPSLPSSAP